MIIHRGNVTTYVSARGYDDLWSTDADLAAKMFQKPSQVSLCL